MEDKKPEKLVDGMGNEIPTVALTEEEKIARQRRSRRIGWALAGFVVLIAAVTMLRLSSNFNAGG